MKLRCIKRIDGACYQIGDIVEPISNGRLRVIRIKDRPNDSGKIWGGYSSSVKSREFFVPINDLNE